MRIKNVLKLSKNGVAKLGKEYKQIAARFLGCSLASYYNWKKEQIPIIAFFEKYLTQENLLEFLDTGKIAKQELIKNIDIEELKNLLKNKDLLYKITEIKTILEGKI